MAALDSAGVSTRLIASLNPKPEFIPLYMTGRYATPLLDVWQYRGMGVGTLGSYEEDPSEIGGGYQAGVRIGEKVLPIYEQWGAPMYKGHGIFVGADTNVSPGQIPNYLDGFRGYNDVLSGMYASGCYGNGLLIKALVDAKLIQVKGWLSSSTSYYGSDPNRSGDIYDRDSPFVGMWQTDGIVVGTDSDTITDITSLGVWWADGQPYVNIPPFEMRDEDMGNKPTMYRQRQSGQNEFGGVYVDIGSGTTKPVANTDYSQLMNKVDGPGWEDVEVDAGLWNLIRNYVTVLEAPLDPAAVASAVIEKLKALPAFNTDGLEAEITTAVHDAVANLHVTIS